MPRSIALSSVLLLLLLPHAACDAGGAGETEGAAGPMAPVEPALAAIDTADLMAYTARLSSDAFGGRAPATCRS